VHTQKYTCTDTCTYTQTHVHTYTDTCTVHTHTCRCTHKHMYTHTHTCTNTHMYIHTDTCTCIHRHTQTHTQIHTHTQPYKKLQYFVTFTHRAGYGTLGGGREHSTHSFLCFHFAQLLSSLTAPSASDRSSPEFRACQQDGPGDTLAPTIISTRHCEQACGNFKA
ncbi:unnamed protein product, partial [Staurois parvus]